MSSVCPREPDSCLWEWILVPSLFLLFFFFIRMKEVLCGRGRALVLPAAAAGETQHVHGGMSLPVSAAWLAVQLVLTLHPKSTQTHTHRRTYVNTQLLRLLIYADSVDRMTDQIWFLVLEGRSGNVCFLSSLQSSWLAFDVFAASNLFPCIFVDNFSKSVCYKMLFHLIPHYAFIHDFSVTLYNEFLLTLTTLTWTNNGKYF